MKTLLCASLCALMALTITPAFASNTIIRVGLAGQSPNDTVQGITTSTSKIDPVLNSIGIPGQPTNDLADDLFNELDDAFTDIEDFISQAVLDVGILTHIYQIDIRPNPARVVISQDGTTVGVKVGDVDGTISIKAEVPVCGSYRIDAKIDNLRVEGDYDLYDGKIKNIAFDYDIRDFDIDAYSFVGTVCKAAIDTASIIVNGSTFKNSILNLLRNAPDNLIIEDQMTDLFSLRDLLDDARQFVQTIDSPGFSFAGYGLPPISQTQRDQATEALNHVDTVLSQPSFQGTGLRVTLELFPRQTNNIINLIVSHAPSDIAAFEVENRCATFSSMFGERTSMATLYRRHSAGSPWTQVKPIYFSGQNFIGDVDDREQFILIGKSNLFGNLYSRPDVDNITTARYIANSLPLMHEVLCDGEGLGGGGGPIGPGGFGGFGGNP